MKKVITFRNKAQVQQEAAAWVAMLDRDELSEQEQTALREWLQADPHHLEVIRKMLLIWGDLDRMAVLAKLFPMPAEPANRPVRGWLGTVALMGIASTALILASLLLIDVFNRDPFTTQVAASHTEPAELVYRTETGEQIEVSLRDGSALMLNTHSQVRVRFNKLERSVFLVDGEVHFDVAKNPDLPFVVYAGNGQVRALGTAFNVRLTGKHVEVWVAEGSVQVSVDGVIQPENVLETATKQTITQSKEVTLKQGGMVKYAEMIEATDYVTEESLKRSLAWRSGKWMFTGETLAEVIKEVSRYTDKQIEIIDPQIADLRIGGYFDIGEIDAFMSVLQSGFGVSVNRVTDDLIQLSASEIENSN